MDYIIQPVGGHYQSIDKEGNFILSGDTYSECVKETEAYLEKIRGEEKA